MSYSSTVNKVICPLCKVRIHGGCMCGQLDYAKRIIQLETKAEMLARTLSHHQIYCAHWIGRAEKAEATIQQAIAAFEKDA